MNSKIISIAIEAHASVNHLYDNKPYSVHLCMVALYAEKYKDYAPTDSNDVINACWLHDTIEDCRLTYNDIKNIAGENAAEIVFAVTNEKGKTRRDRANDSYYAGIRNVPFAKFVKLCDRLANVKYSKDTNSKMLEVYKKENSRFIDSLFPDGKGVVFYQDMVKELTTLLNN